MDHLVRLFQTTDDFATNLRGLLGPSVSATSLRNTMLGIFRPYVAVMTLFETMELKSVQDEVSSSINIVRPPCNQLLSLIADQ